MASKTIKGLTVEIGGDTTKLGKALEGVNKKTRDLSSELGSINKLLKLDPSNVELLAQKQKVLSEAISTTEDKLGKLREAEKQVQAQFERGEVSEAQYRELQREIIATENKLESYQKAAKETSDALEKLGDEGQDAADAVKDTGDAANSAEQEVDDLGSTLGNAAKTGFKALATAAAATVTALVATSEASREYRTAMGKLNTAFKDSGKSAKSAYDIYSELNSVMGDTDAAVEASQQIALLADSEADAAKWAELAAGVVSKFGDALPVESFYEAANEVISLGESTGAYTQLLEQAGYSVDDFNKGLAECKTKADKQAYALKTANKILGQASATYKVNNKDIIRNNKSTEKWNKALSKIGGHVESATTDFKELGVSLLEDLDKPIKAVTKWISDKFIPALVKVGGWVKSNMPVIKAGVAGLTATFVAYKVATLAAELATKGVTVATIAQTVAQKALNLAMAATPWGLVATAITGVVVGLTAFFAATEASKEKVDVLTEAERELQEAAAETAAAFRDQQAATEENKNGIMSQMGHMQNLAGELDNLVDANGRVKEADQGRVDFILGELNAALGTEYKQVDGIVQKYGELKQNIDQVIQAKTANALLEAENADYVEAIRAESEAWETVQNSQKGRDAQLARSTQAEQEYKAAYEEWMANIESGYYDHNDTLMGMDADRVFTLEQKWKTEQGLLDEEQAKYDEAAAHYGEITEQINTYEEAQTAILEGNTQRAVDLLANKGAAYSEFSGEVDSETAKVLSTLKKEAIDAGLEAERTKENFEKGVDGYTKEMVDQANKGYEDAMGAFEKAYSDAYGVGGDLGDGLSGGMENKRSSLMKKARSLVSGIISAMRKEADSNSPAKKTIDFGEDVGEGAEIGIDNKTADVARAGQRQAAALIDAYSSQEIAGQTALRNIADNRAVQQTAGQQAAAAAQGDKLDKILAAIEHGQILTIDGDTLVGATANKMDNTLGQRRALVARGAL